MPRDLPDLVPVTWIMRFFMSTRSQVSPRIPATHPGVERADHDGSEMTRTGREEMLDLFRRQIADAALWLRLHPQDGVRVE